MVSLSPGLHLLSKHLELHRDLPQQYDFKYAVPSQGNTFQCGDCALEIITLTSLANSSRKHSRLHTTNAHQLSLNFLMITIIRNKL